MLQIQQTRIIIEDVTSSVATEEYRKTEQIAARENFWQYRITMNPRLILREKWFPRSLAIKLRKFWNDVLGGQAPGDVAGDAAAARQLAQCHRLHRLKRCRMHGGALGSGAPRGNKNALKHGRFTREAIAERGHIRELVRQARKLLLQIE